MSQEDEECNLLVAGALVADYEVGPEHLTEGPVRCADWCAEDDVGLCERIFHGAFLDKIGDRFSERVNLLRPGLNLADEDS